MNHWKWHAPDPMCGSWVYYQTERVWIAYHSMSFLPELSKITLTCPKWVKGNKYGQFWLAQRQQNQYQLWTAQSQQNDQFENLNISSHEKARNIKFGQQVNIIEGVTLSTLPWQVVMLLAHNHVTNLIVSSYRGATVIKFGQ